MVSETHPSYDIFQLFFETADTGHGGASRDRTYLLCGHADLTSVTYDPETMLRTISNRMRKKVRTVPSDYFMAQTREVQQEAQQLAYRRNIPYQNGDDLSYLLTKREKEAVVSYSNAYLEQYQQIASENPNLVFFLGDSGTKWKTWSARSNAIPTFRRNSKTGLFWIPSLKRFMTAREKLSSLGWPVDTHMATAMHCQPVGSQDILRAADLAGNAMHFTTVAIAQLLGLSCFRPLD